MTELPTDYDGHVMRTPDDWCRIKGIQILDADGWRGRDAKDWSEPLTELDFEERAMVCTQRSVAPQPAGEHHTGTLNLAGQGNPGSPISDAMVETMARTYYENLGWDWDNLDDDARDHDESLAVILREFRTALEAAYPAIRQQVAEQIAAKANQIAEEYQATATTHRDLGLSNGANSRKGASHMNTAHAFRNRADGAWAVAHAAREIGGEA